MERAREIKRTKVGKISASVPSSRREQLSSSLNPAASCTPSINRKPLPFFFLLSATRQESQCDERVPERWISTGTPKRNWTLRSSPLLYRVTFPATSHPTDLPRSWNPASAARERWQAAREYERLRLLRARRGASRGGKGAAGGGQGGNGRKGRALKTSKKRCRPYWKAQRARRARVRGYGDSDAIIPTCGGDAMKNIPVPRSA